jgi:hypothetical protein
MSKIINLETKGDTVMSDRTPNRAARNPNIKWQQFENISGGPFLRGGCRIN